jgi:hypothetical protein
MVEVSRPCYCDGNGTKCRGNDWKRFEESFPTLGKAFEIGGSFEPQPLVCEVIG